MSESAAPSLADKAALDKLYREIASHIASQHNEFEALFERLRSEVRGSFSAILGDEQLPQIPYKQDVCKPWSGPDKLKLQQEVAQELQKQGMFGLCQTKCKNSSDEQAEIREISPLIDEVQAAPALDRLTQATPTKSLKHVVDKECANASKDPSTSTKSESIGQEVPQEVPKDEATQVESLIKEPPDESCTQDNNDRKSSECVTVEESTVEKRISLASKKSFVEEEVVVEEQGEAFGEFKGRGNMFAFLQAKYWDSEYAQAPQFVRKISHAISTRSVQMQKLENAVNSTTFDLVIGSVILANSLVMGLQLEYDAMTSAELIGIESDEGNWPSADEAFLILEHVFAIIYLIELIVRLLVMHCSYFKVALNWLDFIIVTVSVVELYIIPALDISLPDLGIIRLLRVTRIIRVLRMVRVLKLVPKLRVLVVAISHSIWSLVWSLVLLGLVQLIAAVFITQSLQSFLQDQTQDPAMQKQVYTFFGSLSRSCISMFEITLAVGTWGRCGRTVIFGVSRYYALFFLCYMGLVSFAMMRVIAAIFLKDTMASAAKDSDSAMADENRDCHYVKRIWDTFVQLDADGTGSIHLTKLSQLIKEKKHFKSIQSLGVVPHEVVGMFTLMDDGDDEVSFCEFLTGIMRLKNASKGVDLATLLYENKKLLKRILTVGSKIDVLRADTLALAEVVESSSQDK